MKIDSDKAESRKTIDNILQDSFVRKATPDDTKSELLSLILEKLPNEYENDTERDHDIWNDCLQEVREVLEEVIK